MSNFIFITIYVAPVHRKISVGRRKRKQNKLEGKRKEKEVTLRKGYWVIKIIVWGNKYNENKRPSEIDR